MLHKCVKHISHHYCIFRQEVSESPSFNFFTTEGDVSTPQKSSEKKKKKTKHKEKRVKALPNPFSKKVKEDSVFTTPFQKEQLEKQHHLEKHVKLTSHSKDMQEINGKKICMNYRKGRCRFGHQCKFAHDSDLIGNFPSVEESDSPASSLYNKNSDPTYNVPEESRKRKKPGINDGLVPCKLSRSNYSEQQNKELPWLDRNRH